MSNTIYIGYEFKVEPLQPGTEILIAELGSVGFESFVETELGVTAYIQKADWYATILEDIYVLNSNEFKITHTFKEIEQVNWNAEWEKNFTPIVVDSSVTVRAPFHEQPNTAYDIIIEPKMSFGTGHHQTTHMMIQHILKNEFKDKSVLDMGSGTGVLAILAEKRGAKHCDAIDIDEWCYINCVENIERNQCFNIEAFKGGDELLVGKTYDVIIANINRNILIQQMAKYAECLNTNGTLFLSGFYKADIPIIEKECNQLMLKLEETIERDQWVSLKFIN